MTQKLSGIRRGITLIELLVVMMIMLILATIVVAFAPGFQDRQKVGRGADQLQQWLLTARQWAKKDRIPTGIQLTVVNGAVTDMQYIQQPGIFTVPYAVPALTPGTQPATRRIGVSTSAASVSTVTLDLVGTVALQTGQTAGDFSGGQFAVGGATTAYPVQAGDYLVIHGTICCVAAAPTASIPTTHLCDTITLANPLTGNLATIPNTTDYYFVRAARPLTGEATLKLPQDVIIDMTQSVPSQSSTTSGAFNVLFSPSGELLAQTSQNKVIFWIKDSTKPAGYTDDTLIAVDIRTGLIASQPVNVGGSDLYLYTKDARASGL